MLFTMAYAKNAGIWPREKPEEPPEPDQGGEEKPDPRPDLSFQFWKVRQPEVYLFMLLSIGAVS